MIQKIILVMGLLGLGSVYLKADYVIQLGLYKDKTLLQKKIDGIKDSKIKADIIIEKRGELHWAHSKAKKDRASLTHELSGYREYFKDAFPKKVSSIEKEKKENVKSKLPLVSKNKSDVSKAVLKDPQPELKRVINENIASTSVAQKGVSAVKAEITMSSNNAKILPMKKQMNGKIFYICFESKNREIVRIEFDEQYANYSTVVGSRYPFKVFYKVANDRLYTFRDKLSTDSVYLTLEEEQKNYLLMNTWYEGKKVKTMRYYFDLDNAMAHMNRD